MMGRKKVTIWEVVEEEEEEKEKKEEREAVYSLITE